MSPRGTSERVGLGLVALVLVLQFITVVFLWTLNPYSSGTEPAFALYMVVVLISFSMISYVYRGLSGSDRFGRVPVLAGCLVILLLLLLGLFL